MNKGFFLDSSREAPPPKENVKPACLYFLSLMVLTEEKYNIIYKTKPKQVKNKQTFFHQLDVRQQLFTKFHQTVFVQPEITISTLSHWASTNCTAVTSDL